MFNSFGPIVKIYVVEGLIGAHSEPKSTKYDKNGKNILSPIWEENTFIIPSNAIQ